MTYQTALLLIPVIFPIVATLCQVAFNWYKSTLPAAQQAKIQGVADRVQSITSYAVQAVEQTQQGEPGGNKKVTALALVSSLLAKEGITASPEQIDVFIEAAVLHLQHSLVVK